MLSSFRNFGHRSLEVDLFLHVLQPSLNTSVLKPILFIGQLLLIDVIVDALLTITRGSVKFVCVASRNSVMLSGFGCT